MQSDNPLAGISFGPQGSYLAVERSGDIRIAPVDSPQALRSFVATPAAEGAQRVSPDGRLLAYVTDESGRREVYLRTLPGPGPRVQVSTTGGDEPVWSPDAGEIFYRGPSHLMAATVRRTPELAVIRRDTLFEDPYYRGFATRARATYDIFPGGEEFVMLQALSDDALRAIVNWTGELRRRAQSGGGG